MNILNKVLVFFSGLCNGMDIYFYVIRNPLIHSVVNYNFHFNSGSEPQG